MADIREFLSVHTDITHLNKCLAELVFVLKPKDPEECMNALLQHCADRKYKEYIASCPRNFISGLDPYPNIRTTSDPYGIRTPSRHTLYNRRKPIQKIHQCLDTDLPLYDNGSYPWLTDVEATVAACQKAYCTKQSTFDLAKLAVIELCEAIGQPELKTQYFEAFSTVPKLEESKPLPTLTREEVETIRALNQKPIDAAYALIDNKSTEATDRELGVVLEALAVETLWGCSWAHQPLRRDWVGIVYKGAKTDTTTDNYITIDDNSVTLTVNIAHKVGKLKEPLIVDVAPRLAALLRKVHPIACAVQNTDSPHVLWSKTKPVTPSQLSTRMVHIYNKLGFDPGPGRRGANAARHAAVLHNRKRRALTQEERADEKRQARSRLSSVRMAEEHYAQDH
jgi:hypothetical protein